jgi:hypothetical protein
VLNVVELALNLWKHPHGRFLIMCFVTPFIVTGVYLAGVYSVKVDRVSVCAPLLHDQEALRAQISELEGRLLTCRTTLCDECFVDAEAACTERLEAQLNEIKRLRCKVCP